MLLHVATSSTSFNSYVFLLAETEDKAHLVNVIQPCRGLANSLDFATFADATARPGRSVAKGRVGTSRDALRREVHFEGVEN